MAAVMNVIKRTLSISILRGQDVDGNPVTKSYVYSNVKPDVEPEKLLAVGKALGGLFDNDITGLNVVERATLAGILQDFLQSPPKRFAMGQTLPGLTISSTKNV